MLGDTIVLLQSLHGRRDHVVVGFTSTYAISDSPLTWVHILLMARCTWYNITPVSFTNETDCHDIDEILLKVACKMVIYIFHFIW